MDLHTSARRSLTPLHVETAFGSQQCIVIRNIINAGTVRTAFDAFRELMQDPERLARYPYDPLRRTGYTPPGTEVIQRDPGNPDWNRSMFDFDLDLELGIPSIAGLYSEAVFACRLVLVLLDQAYGTSLLRLPQGGHTLRTAQYLLNGTDSGQVLFKRHRDFSLLTAFVGSGTEGLEIEVDGEWHPVDLGYGDLLIGAGTPLAQFHPKLKPLWHRVVGGTDHRLASFLFYELQDNVVLPKSEERYGDMMSRILGDIRPVTA